MESTLIRRKCSVYSCMYKAIIGDLSSYIAMLFIFFAICYSRSLQFITTREESECIWSTGNDSYQKNLDYFIIWMNWPILAEGLNSVQARRIMTGTRWAGEKEAGVTEWAELSATHWITQTGRNRRHERGKQEERENCRTSTIVVNMYYIQI